GQLKKVSLQTLLETADSIWSELDGKQCQNAIDMYVDYRCVLDDWQLPNLKAAKVLQDQYAAVEKTATTEDIDALEALYEGKKPYQGELHDHAATGGTSDGKQPLTVWKAYMDHLDMDFAAIVDHRQTLHMYLDDWDNTMFIGGSEASTTITDREGVKFHYNMTFSDPAGLEKVLNEFTEFKFRIWSEADREGCGGQMHFNYPSFTGARFTELCHAIYENGGFEAVASLLVQDCATVTLETKDITTALELLGDFTAGEDIMDESRKNTLTFTPLAENEKTLVFPCAYLQPDASYVPAMGQDHVAKLVFKAFADSSTKKLFTFA
ncbi:MAG: hypothetical protein IKB99_02855, partial [Lentisphaeria bacterium]|nr:hypothetical protein [Lentisphaeria bacterium]